MTELLHGRVRLALHRLREGEGTPLLLLHALGASSAAWGEGPASWSGPVYALDFSGHGESAWVRGAVYYPELFSADADAALAELERAVLVGAGVGAYAALLLAAGRPEQVPAAVLLPGEGLEGGGAEPGPERFGRLPATPAAEGGGGCDPAVASCREDLRPVDYARDFAEGARALVLVENGTPRPPWWQATGATSNARTAPDLEAALAALGSGRGTFLQ